MRRREGPAQGVPAEEYSAYQKKHQRANHHNGGQQQYHSQRSTRPTPSTPSREGTVFFRQDVSRRSSDLNQGTQIALDGSHGHHEGGSAASSDPHQSHPGTKQSSTHDELDYSSFGQRNIYAKYPSGVGSQMYDSQQATQKFIRDHSMRQGHPVGYMDSTVTQGIAEGQDRMAGPSSRHYGPEAAGLAATIPGRHYHRYPPYPLEQDAAWSGVLHSHQHPSSSPTSVSATSPGKGLEGDSGETGKSSASSFDRKISCLECRSSKVKCSGQSDAGKGCDRCLRINRQCTFEPHRRGRKPSTVKMHKLEQSVDTIMNALSALQEFKEKKEALRQLAEEEATGQRQHGRKRANSDSHDFQSSPVKARNGKGGTAWAPPLETSSQNSRQGVMRNLSDEATNDKGISDLPIADSFALHIPSTSADASRAVGVLDAEAGQELGLPPLSNPLKLLAQASDSALDSARVDNNAQAFLKDDMAEEEGMRKPDKTTESAEGASRTPAILQEDTESRKRGVSRLGYWSFGLYSSRHDVGPALDPVSCGIISLEAAKSLYDMYMRHLNARITLLDPVLATFEYVRKHSALLLTACVALASRFAIDMNDAEALSNSLDAHIQEKLLPAVLLRGFRSVEISQAFIIMAAYHANTASLDGDRSWSLLGYGIRIAAELDMNARILSNRHGTQDTTSTIDKAQSTPDSPDEDAVGTMSEEEDYQRKLRNRERTWCNLWLFENSLSTHMGRRSTLGLDPVVHGVCSGWHRASFAIPGDEAIAAIIRLRRIQLKNVDYFEHSVLGEASKQLETAKRGASPSLKFQLDFYCKSFTADLDAWGATYSEGEAGISWRMKNVRLYASYARLILNSYALKCSNDQELLEPIYKDSYSAAMVYLTLFSERLDSPELAYVHNSAVVTVAYVAVFALRLCSLDTKRYPYIDPKLVFDHVRALAKALARSGNVTGWRNGAASSYAPYLSAILQRVERNTNRGVDGVGQGQASNSNLDSSPPLKVHRLVNSRGDGQGVTSATGEVPLGVSVASDGTGETTGAIPAGSAHPTAATPSIPGLEALSFMAGPSGVQASTILDELTFNDDVAFGHISLQDQFMESSLFNDMNVLLNADTSVDQAYPWSTTPHSQPIQ